VVRLRWDATRRLGMSSLSISPVIVLWLRAGQVAFMTVLLSGASQSRRKTAESMVGFVVPK
jgi:hypothetical protein